MSRFPVLFDECLYFYLPVTLIFDIDIEVNMFIVCSNLLQLYAP